MATNVLGVGIINVHTVFTWTSKLSNLMQLGEIWVAVTNSNIAPAMRGQGSPMKFVMPAEGSPSVNGGLSVVKGGPCEAATYEYLDLYYSDELQAMRMREGGASPSKTAWNLLARRSVRRSASPPTISPGSSISTGRR
jgi:putative spermidine/putrescine transport system substrate-binding protein